MPMSRPQGALNCFVIVAQNVVLGLRNPPHRVAMVLHHGQPLLLETPALPLARFDGPLAQLTGEDPESHGLRHRKPVIKACRKMGSIFPYPGKK